MRPNHRALFGGAIRPSALPAILAAAWCAGRLLFASCAGAAEVSDADFLAGMSRDVVQACRIPPGRAVGGSPTNTTGFTLIMPGGNGGYPAFWVRDFAMSLDSGFVTPEEMLDHLTLIARSQNGPTPRLLARGLVVPAYAIPDHIAFSGGATFYPGTYATGDDQGEGTYGLLPPADDHYWFVHVAAALHRARRGTSFLSNRVDGMAVIDHLAEAFRSPTTDPDTGLFVTSDANRAVGFGFCDGIVHTGGVLFPSLLRHQAAGELAVLYAAMGRESEAERFREIQRRLAGSIEKMFGGVPSAGGWLVAATGSSRQADVWGTLYALHLGVLSPARAHAALDAVVAGVTNHTISIHGAVRHVPVGRDFSARSAWERTGEALNTYQNGAYWHTATGWLIEALWRADRSLARQVAREYVQYLRANDYRLGRGPQAPWECFHPPTGHTQNGVYMTSVTVPFAILKNLPEVWDLPPGL